MYSLYLYRKEAHTVGIKILKNRNRCGEIPTRAVTRGFASYAILAMYIAQKDKPPSIKLKRMRNKVIARRTQRLANHFLILSTLDLDGADAGGAN